MKVIMGSPMKILILLFLFKMHLQEEVDKRNNECLDYLKKTSNQLELFKNFKNSNFFKKSGSEEIDECIYQLLKSGNLEALENILKYLEEGKLELNESLKFKDIRKTLNNNIEKLNNLLSNMKNVVRNYEKNTQIVQPAFKWAQNKDFILIEIKYSHRMDSPGCLELEDLKVDMSYDKIFAFSGFCFLGDVPIKFELALKLFGEINRLQSSWQENSVGKFLLNLKKKTSKTWPSLLRDEELPPANMQVWLEMQEQFDKKEKEAEKAEENEENEEEEEEDDDYYDKLVEEKNKNKKKNRRPKYKFNVLNSDNYLKTHT